MLSIRPPKPAEWQIFYSLAEAEGWKVPQIERLLFQGPWSKFARVLVAGDQFCGLLTAVAHQRSGWIGNLIIAPKLRGRGYGAKLFAAGMSQLRTLGMTSIWLTASELGGPIYKKAGFVTIDQIERWVLPARKDAPVAAADMNDGWDVLLYMDRLAWGENRTDFLQRLRSHSRVIVCNDAVALLQKDADYQLLGPWYSRGSGPQSNDLLLQKIMAAADPARQIIIDLLASSPLRPLFTAAGFHCVGQTALMVSGDVRSVELKTMLALASLGSVG
jgi:predicted GNAT family N-acyltransferase